MIETVVFDTKPYDRDHLRPAAAAGSIEWRFLEFRLTRDTVPTAKGSQAVCVFEALKSGRLGGVALGVFSRSGLSMNRLFPECKLLLHMQQKFVIAVHGPKARPISGWRLPMKQSSADGDIHITLSLAGQPEATGHESQYVSSS